MGFKLKKTKARVVFRSCRLILLILALDNRPPTLIWRAPTFDKQNKYLSYASNRISLLQTYGQ